MQATFLFRDFDTYDSAAADKQLKATAGPVLSALHTRLTAVPAWDAASIHTAVQDVATELGLKFGKVGPPLRVAVTGGTVSPSIDITLELLGREKTLARIAQAVTFTETH